MDPTDETSFPVTLSSRSAETNKAGDFTTHLSEPIVLQGEWQVALTQLITDHNWINISQENGRVLVLHPHPNGQENFQLIFPTGWMSKFVKLLCDVHIDKPADPRKNKYVMTEIPVRPGYYANPSEIGLCIQRDCRHLTQAITPGGLPFYYKYETNLRSCHMFGPVLMLFENAEPFLQAMGIVNEFMTVDATRKIFNTPLLCKNGK